MTMGLNWTMALTVVLMSMLVWSVQSRGHGSIDCDSPAQDDRNLTCMHGEGGSECGKTMCLDDDNVVCSRGRCRCKGDYDKGDGIVVCARPEEEVCYVISDPTMKAFNGERVSIYPSCKFLMSSFDTNMIDEFENDVGDCFVETYSWGVKGRGAGRNGKHYTGGIEARITVTHNGAVYYHATRIHGESRGGLYEFTEQGSQVEGGPYGKAVVTVFPAGLGNISTRYDHDNNIAELKADCCGLRVGFRPPEFQSAKGKELDPGAYVAVDNKNGPSDFGGVCMRPGSSIEDLIKHLEKESGKEVDEETAMLFLLLKSASNQDFPGADKLLQVMADTVQECSTKGLVCAIQECMFITKLPKFMKCYAQRRQKIEEDEKSSEESSEESSEGGSSGQESSESSEGGSSSKESSGGGKSSKNRSRRSAGSKGSGSKDSGSKDSGSKDSGSSSGSGSGDSDEEDPEEVKERERNRMNLVLQLMHRCLQSFCTGSQGMCEMVQEKINGTKCHEIIPENHNSIMDFDCADLGS